MMEDLTFGEQVKIILGRKGMTIKELAETIEAETGMRMSRQNLTQRLGRDNFQEQDMRMIARILGCKFQLSILGGELEKGQAAASAEETVSAETVQAAASAEEAASAEPAQTAALAEEAVSAESAASAEETASAESAQTAASAEETERVESAQSAASAEAQSKASAEETSGAESAQVAASAEETSDAESAQVAASAEEAVSAETAQTAVSAEETASVEPAQVKEDKRSASLQTESERDITIGELYDINEELMELEETIKAGEPVEAVKEELGKPKKERFRPGNLFMWKKHPKGEAQETKKEEKKNSQTFSSQPEPDQDTFEPVIRRADEEEDREAGEINPYTGREYQTDSVRMHPTRIGYVQVYDRSIHKWTDMTEWAFLGYQERKKALLGSAYEPPTYLD